MDVSPKVRSDQENDDLLSRLMESCYEPEKSTGSVLDQAFTEEPDETDDQPPIVESEPEKSSRYPSRNRRPPNYYGRSAPK